MATAGTRRGLEAAPDCSGAWEEVGGVGVKVAALEAEARLDEMALETIKNLSVTQPRIILSAKTYH